MKKIEHVFLDLDGVIFDFHGEVGHQLQDRDVWWNVGFPAFIDAGGFANLPLLPDAQELLQFLYENAYVTILSSAGGSPRFEEILDQKLEALNKHGIVFPAIIVPSKNIKKDYAREGCLLIDDHHENCQDFIDAGGEAIVHVNAAETISHIKEHYNLEG